MTLATIVKQNKTKNYQYQNTHLVEIVLNHFMIYDLRSMTNAQVFTDFHAWKSPKCREITDPDLNVSMDIILPSNRVWYKVKYENLTKSHY